MKGKQKQGMPLDIPEASRDAPNHKPTISQRTNFTVIGLVSFGVFGFSIFLIIRIFFSASQKPSFSSNSITKTTPSPNLITSKIENVLGHLSYTEASLSELNSVTNDGRIKLRKKAAKSFLRMQQDAKRNGFTLIPISGFRTFSQQEYLFFEVKRQQNEETRKRAEVSAPPQYSEHHTGYAIDIGDSDFPSTHLNVEFENTPLFQWLRKNAAKYNFELSFPPNNIQNISYEPWHWRYIGDAHSLETFFKARNLQKESLQ
ncbi:MAG: D-alanyl-D-alanine carboxypeptidase family protein [Candidatus Atelocyanobacterium thalassa]